MISKRTLVANGPALEKRRLQAGYRARKIRHNLTQPSSVKLVRCDKSRVEVCWILAVTTIGSRSNSSSEQLWRHRLDETSKSEHMRGLGVTLSGRWAKSHSPGLQTMLERRGIPNSSYSRMDHSIFCSANISCSRKVSLSSMLQLWF